MPCRKVEAIEYECARCSYRWINQINGNEGPKPKRCSRCKTRDWDEGRLSRLEKRLRRDILKAQNKEIRCPFLVGTPSYSIPTDICATFLSIVPRSTIEELTVVLNPICYLGPHDHGISPLSHTGTCSDQVDTRCYPGWRPVPDKPGHYRFDQKMYEEMVTKEKEIRHELMQHIIDSREGIVNTNSTHYRYYENKKQQGEDLSRFEPLKMLASKGG
ncbi:MAG TPA: hypothetical protein VEL11_13680 [Candidatus Bathyarchaeia archaeon]|nr:hypothetical protein [Candidatus Bathyarchaeia archaeon]